MHNEQILPLFCGSAFCAEGGAVHGQRCSSGRIEALWSPFTWRCKREPAWRRAGKVRAAPPRVEAQALWELVRRCKHHGAHPQVRVSGAHPGLQVLWLVLHWGVSVVVHPLRGAASAVLVLYVEVPASRLVLCVGVSERQ